MSVYLFVGVDNGTVVRLMNQGDAGLNGGRAGHLFVRIIVDPHPFFRRDGADVHVDVRTFIFLLFFVSSDFNPVPRCR